MTGQEYIDLSKVKIRGLHEEDGIHIPIEDVIRLLDDYKKQLTLTDVSDMLILTPKDAELFFNEVMNPKKANEALKKAMLKFITR
jgi:hypothetical protein